jgi:hypothetical protein
MPASSKVAHDPDEVGKVEAIFRIPPEAGPSREIQFYLRE